MGYFSKKTREEKRRYERINAHMINDFEHQYNAEGYKLDQGGYSYEEVYAHLTQKEENTWDGDTGYSYFSDSDRHELGRYEVAQAEEEDPQAKAEASKEYRAYLEDMVLIEFSPVLDFIWKNESASR